MRNVDSRPGQIRWGKYCSRGVATIRKTSAETFVNLCCQVRLKVYISACIIFFTRVEAETEARRIEALRAYQLLQQSRQDF